MTEPSLLVVIDPKSAEQVERLDAIYQATLDSAPEFYSLADVMHAALLTYADALTRWSERLRMAFEGCDYREDRARADSTGGAS